MTDLPDDDGSFGSGGGATDFYSSNSNWPDNGNQSHEEAQRSELEDTANREQSDYSVNGNVDITGEIEITYGPASEGQELDGSEVLAGETNISNANPSAAAPGSVGVDPALVSLEQGNYWESKLSADSTSTESGWSNLDYWQVEYEEYEACSIAADVATEAFANAPPGLIGAITSEFGPLVSVGLETIRETLEKSDAAKEVTKEALKDLCNLFASMANTPRNRDHTTRSPELRPL
jgi:hypothetical protein